MSDSGTWSLLFERLADGVCVCDERGMVLYMNPAARGILGLPPGRPGAALCDILCRNLAAPGRRDCSAECPLREPGSAHAAVTYRGHYYGSPVSPVMKDIRVRCQTMPGGRRLVLLEELRSGSVAARASEEEDPLSAQDLRANLAAASEALGQLRDVPPDRPLDEDERRLIGLGAGACARAVDLLGLHEELARLEPDLAVVRCEPVVLRPLIERCVGRAEPAALERQIGIEVRIQEGMGVLADPGMLERVLDNLLLNGLKATPVGGLVTVSAAPFPGRKARISFQDGAPGAAPEKLAELFDRFYQARALKEERRRGVGLRWLFCRRAVHAMGGRFELHSEPGASRSVIELPAA